MIKVALVTNIFSINNSSALNEVSRYKDIFSDMYTRMYLHYSVNKIEIMQSMISLLVLIIFISIILYDRNKKIKNVKPYVLGYYYNKSKKFSSIYNEYFNYENKSNGLSVKCADVVDNKSKQISSDIAGGSVAVNKSSDFISNRVNNIENIVIEMESNGVGPKNLSKEVEYDYLGLRPAIGETFITSFDFVSKYISVNEEFLKAISAFTYQDINNFIDLHKYVTGNAFDHAGTLKDGWVSGVVSGVQGHLGEQYVAEHFRQLGHTVEFAPTPNNPGWDLKIDGHPVDVKTVFETKTIHEHFANYPDIPVVVPEHIGGMEGGFKIDPHTGVDQFKDALHTSHSIISDSALDHAAIKDQADTAFHAPIEASDVSFHIPWITVVFSSYREAKLLMNDDTDLSRSAKNIACDAAGTGIGGIAGAKGGAALGTLILPGIGTVVGTILGGIGGALFGRSLSNQVKYAPLNDAKEKYERAHKKLKREFKKEQLSIDSTYEEEKDKVSIELKEAVGESSRKLFKISTKCGEAIRSSAILSNNKKQDIIAMARENLEMELQEAKLALAKIAFWRRYLWPDLESIKVLVAYKYAVIRLKEFDKALVNISNGKVTESEKGYRLFDFVLSLGYGEKETREFLKLFKMNVDEGIRKLALAREDELKRIFELRKEKMGYLANVINRLLVKADEKIKPYLKEFKSEGKAFKKEMKAFGIKS